MGNVYRNIGSVVKDKGGIWDRLDDQLHTTEAAPVEPGLGLWGMIVTGTADGLWDKADEETVFLRRDKIDRSKHDLWSDADDETIILPKEGMLAIWDAVLAKTDALGSVDLEGTLMVMREDVESVWSRSADETLVLSRPGESIFAQQVRSRDLTSFRPRRIQGYALKKLTDTRGDTYWILKNLRTDAYLRLTEEQVFLWEQMDGTATVQDIAVAYMLEYGKLAINSLLVLLDQLQGKGFIESLVNIYGAADRSVAERRSNVLWRRLARGFVNTELSIGGIDHLVTRSYEMGGRLLFTRIAQWTMLAVIAVGGAAFLGMLLGLTDHSLTVFTGGGTGAVIGIITLYVLQFATLLIHEWSHAVTTKHYGREVRRGGFLLYIGMPAAFVDTTDIWMEPRRPRIAVSWAGPHSGFFLGGLASLLVLAGPGPFLASLLSQFALLTYVTSFTNLNPLLKLDGYYILMDWLEIPRLRERSMAFVRGGLLQKLRTREKLVRDEQIFAVFGVLSALWTAIALILSITVAGGHVLSFAQTPVGTVLLVLLVGGVVILWGRRFARATRRRRRIARSTTG
ncbi:MAG TPA: hypothetical protein PKD09_19445 [Aggregatilinea sp.]|uniref:hypothetical protein n=1 Tax=Aggregatilinea sp. TaxID=2806333 RepID=UPI002CBF9069|nr:hypothetical protein [Aggregatilinea sp.]HML23840.1 hypothetical protein [Aggregatilinea sp.]